jgi:amidohydrolase|tara:strand:+ start:26612 stop:27763 length:1152 start_codon:yes stop_codon:yes gene_type:complete
MEKIVNTILPSLEQIRKEIHKNPELSEHEYNTSKRIQSYLSLHTNGKVKAIAQTGVMVTFDSGIEGNSIMLRADTDALPIEEINTFDYKSNSFGISHKCGHDGHTAMMLGVARMLTENPIKKGKVVLLFQPAEENGMGAEAVLNDDHFQNLKFDYVFALHNIPGYPKNQIILKENIFNANVKSMIIKLKGKTAHAAEPEKGYNPGLALAEIMQYAEKITNNNPSAEDFFLITPVHMKMGDLAYGISAGEGELHLTIRSWDLKLFDEKCADLESFINNKCAEFNLKPEISWTQIFFANKNDNSANEFVRKAAKHNKFDIHEKTDPFKWGEDFGLFTQLFKGAMFGLGAGETTPALHNPDYDFPDDITSTGIRLFFQIIQETTNL